MITTPLPTSMRCISVSVPWTWYLMYGGKDVENRKLNFPNQFRGRVLIQASKTWHKRDTLLDMECANNILNASRFRAKDAPEITLDYLYATRGHAIGTIEIVDCVTESNSPWFFGPLGVQVSAPIPFAKPVPMRGMLGLLPWMCHRRSFKSSSSSIQKCRLNSIISPVR